MTATASHTPELSRIFYTKPSITEAEVEAVTAAARDGWGPRCYESIQRFEAEFAAFVGCRHAIATSSCTGSLHMGLAALGVGAGDEVILGDINWIASAAPATYLGAKPVFVDILADSWCLDPDKVEAAITPKTKAIIAVHVYGNLCDLDRLLEIGARHGIPVIEDAAEAIGSKWLAGPDGERHAGSRGRFGTFSFHGTKTLTTGEGGMFVTNDTALYEQVLALSNHGRIAGEAKQFWPGMIGFKYKMSNIQAALGCAQMARIDQLVARKRAIFQHYADALAGLPGISMNPQPAGTENGYWMPTVVFAPELQVTREALLAAFKAANIDGRVFFWPLSGLPMFAPKPANSVAYSLPARSFNLPSYHDLSPAEQDRVIAVVRQVIADAT
jgi:perosamine synthetase